MKFQVILLVALVSCAVAETSMLQSKAQMQARATDAVDSALDVLRGLKQANVDAQALADAKNKTDEAAMNAEIADLTALADSNKAAGDAATEHRKYIENEIDVTNQYLRWIVARREELIRKRGELQEQRCVASMAFVKALKEHDEALQVVAMLKQDVVGVVEEHTGIHYEGLAQIDKLAAYTHLFNDKAMEAFSQLAQSNPAQAVDSETHEWDEGATDNNRKAIELENADYMHAERDVAHRFIDMINTLEQHLVDSVADLKKNEIQAAWDMVNWMQESENELAWLDTEQEAQTIYIDKLVIAVVGAKSHEERLWDIYFDSAMTLNDSLKAREVRRDAYMAEKARRDEENIVLDDIVQMFIAQVSVLDARSRAGATDYADDGSFNKSNGDYTLDRVDASVDSVNATNAAANKAAAAAPYL